MGTERLRASIAPVERVTARESLPPGAQTRAARAPMSLLLASRSSIARGTSLSTQRQRLTCRDALDWRDARPQPLSAHQRLWRPTVAEGALKNGPRTQLCMRGGFALKL